MSRSADPEAGLDRDSDIDHTLSALAVPARRTIVDLLSAGPRSAGELAGELSLPKPALSKHLRVLKAAGLIEQRSVEGDGRVCMMHLRRAPLGELRTWLDRVEAFWGDQLLAFKAHAEEQHRKGRNRR
ncbi:MAG: metalloregulator ArsR/SmtB family transcription factor [Polyangiaceae bacterium]